VIALMSTQAWPALGIFRTDVDVPPESAAQLIGERTKELGSRRGKGRAKVRDIICEAEPEWEWNSHHKPLQVWSTKS
jgi:hypothetical protein